MGRKRAVTFSLNQQIRRFTTVLFLLLSCVSIIWLLFLVRNYQHELNRMRQERIASYNREISAGIRQLNSVLDAYYMSNKDFSMLLNSQGKTAQWNRIYSLLSSMELQVRSGKNYDGLVLFYNGLQDDVYYMDPDIPFQDIRLILSSYRELSRDHTYEESVVAGAASVYWISMMTRGTASIGGIVRLDRGLPKEKDDTAGYGVVIHNAFYPTDGQMRQLSSEECAILTEDRNRVGDKIVYCGNKDSSGIMAVEILPDNIWLYADVFHIILLFFILLLFPLGVHIHHFVVSQLSLPLEDMTEAMLKIQEGDWSVRFHEPSGVTEIENVKAAIQVMLSEIEHYQIKVYEEQLNVQQTQLQYLRLRLTPHFYTNCLKNAYYMLELGEYEKTGKFLLCMSTHLRYLLQKDISKVTLEDEISFVQNYIKMQQFLLDGKVECHFQPIESNVNKARIPILLIQTFVENAVKYARTVNADQLIITVNVHLLDSEKEKYLDIGIHDNGPGYPEELLNQWNRNGLENAHHMTGGIINLLSRLRINYGRRASWYFRNDNGAVSEIIIPAENQEHGDAGHTAI